MYRINRISSCLLLRGWKVSNSEACPDNSTCCVDPQALSCSFKGCDALKLHDDSFNVSLYDPYDQASQPTLRGYYFYFGCGIIDYDYYYYGDYYGDYDYNHRDYEKTFIWTDTNDDFLTNNLSEMKDFLKNHNWYEQHYENFKLMKVQCSKDREWKISDRNIRYSIVKLGRINR